MAAKSGDFPRLLNPFRLYMKKFELAVTCPSCWRLLSEPILLPCDHMVCSQCMTTEDGCHYHCPACPSTFSSGDARPQSHIKEMVYIFKSLAATTVPIVKELGSQVRNSGMEVLPVETFVSGPNNTEGALQVSPAASSSGCPPRSIFFQVTKRLSIDGLFAKGKEAGKNAETEGVLLPWYNASTGGCSIMGNQSMPGVAFPLPHSEEADVRETKTQKLNIMGVEVTWKNTHRILQIAHALKRLWSVHFAICLESLEENFNVLCPRSSHKLLCDKFLALR